MVWKACSTFEESSADVSMKERLRCEGDKKRDKKTTYIEKMYKL
jgi:hypothetical protein